MYMSFLEVFSFVEISNLDLFSLTFLIFKYIGLSSVLLTPSETLYFNWLSIQSMRFRVVVGLLVL